MRFLFTTNWARPVIGLIGAVAMAAGVLFVGGGALAQTDWDHSKIVGPDECAECHKAETEVWRGTHHFSTFREMPRDRDASEIARRMGLRRIKEGSLCLDCHFTTQQRGGERDAIAGISCESCHGPAQGWLKVHSEFSGLKEGQESPAQIAARWAASERAGMIRPGNMYAWAKNCFSCHVVPQEELVNRGGHTAGSDFELVSWSQGEIRHNLWYNDGARNEPASIETKRLMFVVGRAVELEIALRAVARATERDKYAVAMAKRADTARRAVAQLGSLLGLSELRQMAQIADDAGLRLNNRGPLERAASQVGRLAQQLADRYDGSRFSAIDRYLPSEQQYKGRPAR